MFRFNVQKSNVTHTDENLMVKYQIIALKLIQKNANNPFSHIKLKRAVKNTEQLKLYLKETCYTRFQIIS